MADLASLPSGSTVMFDAESSCAPADSATAEILEHVLSAGSVLLRNCNLGLDDFEAFTRQFCDTFYPASNRHIRSPLDGDGHSNEVARSNYILFGHTEGTYRPCPPPPDVCFFMCQTPPLAPGGETTLVDGVAFLERLPTKLRRRFARAGITYEMSWEREKWQMEFSVEDTRSLRGILSGLGGVSYSLWKGMLHLYFSTKAITLTKAGEEVFAPALLAHLPYVDHPGYRGLPVYAKASNRVYFGDGEPIPDETINALIDIHDELICGHRWQAGDVLVVDNTRVMHGRRMTTIPCERRIASRFGWLSPGILQRCPGDRRCLT